MISIRGHGGSGLDIGVFRKTGGNPNPCLYLHFRTQFNQLRNCIRGERRAGFTRIRFSCNSDFHRL
jgi:hypothetical protein